MGPSVVLKYVNILLSLGKHPYHIFFDNFFTTVPLLEELGNNGIRGTGTIRENRTSRCPLEDSKSMKKAERGCFDYRVTESKSVVVVRWNDNNILNVASNCEGVFPLQKVRSDYTLHELLQEIDDIQTNGLSGTSPLNIGILPPNNACDELTDEDSGEEDFVSVNNLPPSQLLANAEIINADVGGSDSDSDPEYNTPQIVILNTTHHLQD
ncbi:Transposase IS4 [Popillia japonica]|uniref:Transposase IS4 n=1 Tax=Popillia japonica TaxID=7064 RepID=A0AAW1IX04_POPJA